MMNPNIAPKPEPAPRPPTPPGTPISRLALATSLPAPTGPARPRTRTRKSALSPHPSRLRPDAYLDSPGPHGDRGLFLAARQHAPRRPPADRFIALSAPALIALTFIVRSRMRQFSDPLWIAHRLGSKRLPRSRCPTARRPRKSARPRSRLSRSNIAQSNAHARKEKNTCRIGRHSRQSCASSRTSRPVRRIVLFGGVLVWLGRELQFSSAPKIAASLAAHPPRDFDIRIVPEDTSVELQHRSIALVHRRIRPARALPPDVQLLYREGDNGPRSSRCR